MRTTERLKAKLPNSFSLRSALIVIALLSVFAAISVPFIKERYAISSLSEAWTAIEVDYGEGTGWEIGQYGRLSKAVGIRLVDATIDAEFFGHVANLRELKYLELRHCRYSGCSAKSGVANNSIVELSLNRSQIPIEMIQALLRSPGLRSCDLQHASIAGISDFPPRLVTLVLDGTDATDFTLSLIKGCTALRCLSLRSTGITDVGLQHLKDIQSLEELRLDKTQISEAGIKWIVNERCKALSLDNTNVTDGMASIFAAAKSIELLSVRGTKTGDALAAAIGDQPKIKKLCMAQTQLTDIGIRCVLKASTLEELDISATKVSDDGIVDFRTLSNIRRLDMRRVLVTDAALIGIKKLDKLVWLDVQGTGITDESLRELQRSRPGLQIAGMRSAAP